MSNFMQSPCKHCPYRRDVKPFLTAQIGEDLAYLTQNEYNSFYCHKTYSHDDEGEVEYNDGTKMCAGFLTMVANNTGNCPEGFTPSYDMVYTDELEMIDAYENPEDYEKEKQ